MAVLKYYKEDGTWGNVGLPEKAITPDSIGAIPIPDTAENNQILTYKDGEWIAEDAPDTGVTSINGQTGAVSIGLSDIGAAAVSTQFDMTLTPSSWNGSICDINNNAIKSTSVIELLPASSITKEQYEALAGAMIVGSTQRDGQIKLKALGEVPTVDIPVTFIVRGDM